MKLFFNIEITVVSLDVKVPQLFPVKVKSRTSGEFVVVLIYSSDEVPCDTEYVKVAGVAVAAKTAAGKSVISISTVIKQASNFLCREFAKLCLIDLWCTGYPLS